MFFPWISTKKIVEDYWTLAIEVFTTGKRDGLKRSLIHFVICSIFSLFLSSLLILYLFYGLDYDLTVSGSITVCFGFLFNLALFLSKKVRCYGTLFFISIFMKKSRNLLLMAGTSVVVLRNIQNTLDNLTGLARSMVCNFNAKKEAITSPFSNYVKMLKWLGNVLKGVTDLGVVNLDSKLKITPKVESEILRQRLVVAETMLNETIKDIQAIVSTISSVSSKIFPAISFLLLLAFLVLQVTKYRKNLKYKNKFITRTFVHFDERQKEEGRPHVLPLTTEEEKLFTTFQFLRPKEGMKMLKFCVPVASHLVAWALFITVDALLYLFVDIVTTKLSEMEPFHVPLILRIRRISSLVGIPLDEENHTKDFSYSITLFEKKCLPKPKLLLFNSIAPLVVIFMMLMVMAIMVGKLSQLRLIVCERFFITAAEHRAEYLHAKILRKRKKKRKEKGEDETRMFLQLHFWFPLLFRPKEDPPNIL